MRNMRHRPLAPLPHCRPPTCSRCYRLLQTAPNNHPDVSIHMFQAAGRRQGASVVGESVGPRELAARRPSVLRSRLTSGFNVKGRRQPAAGPSGGQQEPLVCATPALPLPLGRLQLHLAEHRPLACCRSIMRGAGRQPAPLARFPPTTSPLHSLPAPFATACKPVYAHVSS